MKNIALIIVAGLFLTACGGSEQKSDNNSKRNPKMTEFLSNFQELSFPIEINKDGFDTDDPVKEIDFKYIDLISDAYTEEEYNGENYEVRYIYVGKKTLPDKDFDIFIVFEKPNIKRSDIAPVYDLFTVSKDGQVIDIKGIAQRTESYSVISYSTASINSNLEITVHEFIKELPLDGSNQMPENFTQSNTKYLIDNKGKITEQKEELTGLDKFSLFYQKVPELTLPLKFNGYYNRDSAYHADLDEFDFLREIKTLASKTSKCDVIGKINAAADFSLFLIATWDEASEMSGENALYSISLDGEILDKLLINEGNYGEQVIMTVSDKVEITLLNISHEEDDLSNPPYYTESKYTIGQTGGFIQVQKPTSYLERMKKDFALSSEDVEFMESARKEFYAVHNSGQLADYMHNKVEKSINILNKHMPDVGEPDPYVYVSDIIPFISMEYAPEGNGIEANPNYYPLYEKAKSTPEKDDDLFFEAFTNGNKIYEDSDSKKKYLQKFNIEECNSETCYVILGGGKCYNTLLKIDKAMIPESHFTSDLQALKNYILNNAFYEDADFGYTKEKVSEYTDKTLSDINLTDAQKAKLNAFKIAVKTKPDSNFSIKKD